LCEDERTRIKRGLLDAAIHKTRQDFVGPDRITTAPRATNIPLRDKRRYYSRQLNEWTKLLPT
jgi:hypothetical protein